MYWGSCGDLVGMQWGGCTIPSMHYVVTLFFQIGDGGFIHSLSHHRWGQLEKMNVAVSNSMRLWD